jgi:hypothetical protein
VPVVHVAEGCTQLPETALKVLPLTLKPDQLLLTSVAARALPAVRAVARAMRGIRRRIKRAPFGRGSLQKSVRC